MVFFERPVRMIRLACIVCLWLACAPGGVEAQLLPALPFNSRQFRIEQIGDNHLRLTGEVEITEDDYRFFADEVDVYTDESRLVAVGNVVYAGDRDRVSGDRAEFNLDDRTATFYNASGSVTLGEELIERSMFGTQEPDMLFYGEVIEKLGPRSYRLTRGGFTSCVQPTPRWQMTASTLTLDLDSHALLRNSVLEVKGVPVLYLPFMYYPIPEEDRATGFLMPTYGASTFRGQSLSNAFFWAVNRSQDATLYHDWFPRSGQGRGAEYRYTRGGGSQGRLRAYFLSERETSLTVGGEEREFPSRQSYELRGNARQRLAPNLSVRGQIDYFSDVTVQQQYQTNILEASSRQRSMSANIAGAWGLYQLSGTFEMNETFFGDRDSTLWGAGPRVTFDQSQRQVLSTPFYFSFQSEYAHLLRSSTVDLNPFTDHVVPGLTEMTLDSGLDRFDVNPVLQIPFARWPFLSVDSSVSWRGTYWTERLDIGRGASRRSAAQIDDGIGRAFFDLQSQITGPSFVKVWDTPDSGYAERMKHLIEPWVILQRTTAVDDFDRIVQLEATDAIPGNVTQIRYGVNNRLYARRAEGNQDSIARDILSVIVSQAYYSDAHAAQFDPRFQTSFSDTPPSHLSPVKLDVRTELTRRLSGSLRAEYDTQFMALRTVSAEGTIGLGGWLRTTAGWSQRRFVDGLGGFTDPSRLDHYLNAFTSLRTRDNTFGGAYSFHYDVERGRYLQQRALVYYNAQCCGISGELQSFNFEGLGARARVPRDLRLSLSFTLAGLGTFANVLGAFGLGQGA